MCPCPLRVVDVSDKIVSDPFWALMTEVLVNITSQQESRKILQYLDSINSISATRVGYAPEQWANNQSSNQWQTTIDFCRLGSIRCTTEQKRFGEK